jgi:hypothetical protein
MEGFRDYFLKNQDYVKTQVGNPEGEVSKDLFILNCEREPDPEWCAVVETT